MSVNEFRFDVAYESVYQFDTEKNAYFYVGSFAAFGVSQNDNFKTAIAKARAGLNQ